MQKKQLHELSDEKMEELDHMRAMYECRMDLLYQTMENELVAAWSEAHTNLTLNKLTENSTSTSRWNFSVRQ